MVLVHDDDLAQLDVINSAGGAVSKSLYCAPMVLICSCVQPLESLPLDALLSRLRSAKPKIHGIPLDTGELLVVSRAFLFLTAEALPKRSAPRR
jgi:hypothetical protein